MLVLLGSVADQLTDPKDGPQRHAHPGPRDLWLFLYTAKRTLQMCFL